MTSADQFYVRKDSWTFCQAMPIPSKIAADAARERIEAGMGWFQSWTFDASEGWLGWQHRDMLHPITRQTFIEASHLGFNVTELDLAAWEEDVVLLVVHGTPFDEQPPARITR